MKRKNIVNLNQCITFQICSVANKLALNFYAILRINFKCICQIIVYQHGIEIEKIKFYTMLIVIANSNFQNKNMK
jgi:hypothetical protein